MCLREKLAKIDGAEEIFALLRVEYDSGVLARCRLLVLKQFGKEVARIELGEPPPTEAQRCELYADALRRTYEQFRAGSGPKGDPVFPGMRHGLLRIRVRHSVDR